MVDRGTHQPPTKRHPDDDPERARGLPDWDRTAVHAFTEPRSDDPPQQAVMLSRPAFPIAATSLKRDLAAGSDPITTSEPSIADGACDVEATDYVRKHHHERRKAAACRQ
jgi:hypothetical protein